MRGPILVTGSAGFAGSHLLECVAGHGEIAAWTRLSPPPEGLAPLAIWQPVDLLDRERVRAAIRDLRPSAVYHCAGAAHVANSWQDTAQPLASNVLATHYLLDALRRAGGQCRVVIAGSATVYAPSATPLDEESPLAPTSPYALSKLALEQLGLRALREDGIEVILTRPFNHTGPRQSHSYFAPAVARQIAMIDRGAAEPVIRVGNLDAQRDLTDVRDTVRAYVLLMEKGLPGTVYNIASGVGRSMRVVLDGLLRRAQTTPRVEVDPARLRPHDVPIHVGDGTRLRATTGWTPAISFDQMLDDLLGYWRQTVA